MSAIPGAPAGSNDSKAVSGVRVAADLGGRWKLGVIGKRTWTIAGDRCVPSDKQVPLVEEPLYDENRGVLLHDADVLLNRERVDIVVEGHAYPPRGRASFEVEVRVGAMSRTALAFGERRVLRDPGGRIRFSDPAPVERIPLAWESAYGGVDAAARADIGDPFEKFQVDAGLPSDPRYGLFAYPRNPVGRGYVIEPTPQALEACALPLLEDPATALTPDNLVQGDFVRWPLSPAVASFGWLSYSYFPRSALLGVPPLVYDGLHIPPASFREVTSGDLHDAAVRPERPITERLGLAVAQSASIGMRTPEVRPGDAVMLSGVHPKLARFDFQIPEPTPRMSVRFGKDEQTDLEPRIRTVFLQPDEDRLILVWTAEMEVPYRPGDKRLQTLEHVVLWDG